MPNVVLKTAINGQFPCRNPTRRYLTLNSWLLFALTYGKTERQLELSGVQVLRVVVVEATEGISDLSRLWISMEDHVPQVKRFNEALVAFEHAYTHRG